ncbi:M35 family metallo-endopeptidase [Geodermatophilus sp. CPCC 205761]|uniref:M35 family metallo-endopeptidase n=1 Tax=Geodermatophilus sp. CPCC 205761 TaxID=2936597 RepID=UPI003EE86B29
MSRTVHVVERQRAGPRRAAARRDVPLRSPVAAPVLQRQLGNQAVARLRVQRACCGSCSSGGPCEGEPEQRTAPSVVPGVVQRYYTEDCEGYSVDQRRNGVSEATSMARRAVDALTAYTAAHPGGTQDPRTAQLLRDCFASDSLWTAMRARAGFARIKAYLDADDFTIECEDDCDTANAYVYGVWTDIHMCMNVIKNESARRFGEILLHEVSHDAHGTDDEQYFYPPAGSRTTLSVGDALDNADSYEAFAAQI